MASPILVNVVGVEKRDGVAKTTGKPYKIRRAQLVANIEGQNVVATASLPKEVDDIAPGPYLLHLAPYVRDGELQFRIASYEPRKA